MKKTLLTCVLAICLNLICSAQPEYSFGPEITIPTETSTTGAFPYVIASGDLNNDLDLFNDIVIGTYNGNTIEIYSNDGDGTFTLQTPVKSLATVGGLHVVDWDGVNGVDILATSYTGDRLVWYQNDGSGNFTLQPDISSAVDGAGQVTTANINNDPHLDIVLVVYGNDGSSDRVVWFEGTGGGGYLPEQLIDVGATANGGPGSIGIADVDNDTDLDVVVGYTDLGTIEIYYNQYFESGTMTVGWIQGTNVHSGDTYLFVTGFADYNDDGAIDIIKTDIDNTGNDDVSWYDGASSYMENPISYSANLDYPGIIVPTDINNDGYSDFLISNGATLGDDIILHQSSGPGTYYPIKAISVAQNQVFGITIDDFNGDTLLDIASVDYQNNELNWFPNLGEVLGIDDNELNSIGVYPNPSSDKLYFKGMNTNFDVSVYDILGKEILLATLEVDEALEISHLSNGVYILKLVDQNKTFKIIKE